MGKKYPDISTLTMQCHLLKDARESMGFPTQKLKEAMLESLSQVLHR